jgi:hypothetical protein
MLTVVCIFIAIRCRLTVESMTVLINDPRVKYIEADGVCHTNGSGDSGASDCASEKFSLF